MRALTGAALLAVLGTLGGCHANPFGQDVEAFDDDELNPKSLSEAPTVSDSESVADRDLDSQIVPVAFEQPAVEQTQFQNEVLLAPLETSDDLTLAELEQLALAGNPVVARESARLRALEGKWVQAGLPPNPFIGYAGEEMGDDGTAGLQGGYASQRIIRGGKLELDQGVVRQEMMRAQELLAVAQLRVLTDVRLSYYQVLVTQKRKELAQQLVDVSTEAVTASEQLLEAQEIPRVGLLQAEVQAENANLLLQQSQNEVLAAWRQLTAIIGRPALPIRPLTGDIDHETTLLNWDDQVDRLITGSPEVAAAVARWQRARSALQRACAEPIPDAQLQVTVQQNDANDDTVASLQLGLALPLWNRNQGRIMQAQQEIIASRRDLDRVGLDLQQRLADQMQRYATARIQVQKFTEEILPRSEEVLNLIRQGYRSGEVGYLDNLTAQRTYFQTNLAYIKALQDLWLATTRIEGMLLDGSLTVNYQPTL